RSFTSNHTKRKTWINAVRWTPEVLCSTHFSPSAFVEKANRIELRIDAVPFYWKGQAKEAKKDSMNELTETKNDESVADVSRLGLAFA
ncbi:hypothetical protein PMAYCL1PPCAC_27872, partial [Pristionchus mayeri]